jgi:hypothetical protein
MPAEVWRSTAYVEIDGSPTGSMTRSGSRVSRVVDVLNPLFPDDPTATVGQEVLRQAALDFVGYSQRLVSVSVSAVPYVSRVTPAPHPRLPRMYCTGIQNFQGVALRGKEEVVNEGGFHPSALYNRWRCTLEYSTLPFKVLDDISLNMLAAYGATDEDDESFPGVPDESSGLRYTSRSGEYGGKFVTIPRAMMYTWPPGAAAAIPVGEGVPIWESEDSVVLTWFDVPEEAVPWTALRLAQGTLNDAAFTFRGVTYPRNSLLFLNVRMLPDMDVRGEHTLTLQLNFRYAAHVSRDPATVPAEIRGQNWLLNYVPGPPPLVDYVLVASSLSGSNTMTTGATKLFRETDFRLLFRAE